MNNNIKSKVQNIKNIILQKALEVVALNGWRNDTLDDACSLLGLHPKLGKLIFANNANDTSNSNTELITYYFNSLNDQNLNEYWISELYLKTNNIDITNNITNKLHTNKPHNPGTTMKVLHLMHCRLNELSKNEILNEALKQTMSYMLLPWNITTMHKITWYSASCIWEMIGDQSTDYNYYSKRSILSTLYYSSLIFVLKDESNEKLNTHIFAKNMINKMMQISKLFKK